MMKKRFYFAGVLAGVAMGLELCTTVAAPAKKPNIIAVMPDDLGYGDHVPVPFSSGHTNKVQLKKTPRKTCCASSEEARNITYAKNDHSI